MIVSESYDQFLKTVNANPENTFRCLSHANGLPVHKDQRKRYRRVLAQELNYSKCITKKLVDMICTIHSENSGSKSDRCSSKLGMLQEATNHTSGGNIVNL